MPVGKKQQRKLSRLVEAAERLAAQGQPQQAVETAVAALGIDEQCLPAYLLIARIQLQHDNREPAAWAIGEALRLAPESATVLFDSAKIRRLEGDLATAAEHARRALSLDPALPAAAGFLVHVLDLQGRETEARERLDEGLRAYPDDVALGLAFADLAVRLGRVPEAVARLERHLKRASTGERYDLLFRLSRLCDHRGDHDRAFASVAEAHRLIPRAWDAAAYDRAAAAVTANWTPAFLSGAPRRATADSSHLVFIVGMPRSGTTLVEQLLASHPQVSGGGELPWLGALAVETAADPSEVIPFSRNLRSLTAESLGRIGEGYVNATAGLVQGKARLTDKMPANHAHLGLVELALGGARIVHCRRDARDVAVSCFMTSFQASMRFTSDLQHIGRYASAEQRLMAHWKAVLGVPILTVDYEDLVADIEAGARRLLAFAGLEWDDTCLDFHQSTRFVNTASARQVREPVYRSSVGRWRKYEKHLEPLLEVLSANTPG